MSAGLDRADAPGFRLPGGSGALGRHRADRLNWRGQVLPALIGGILAGTAQERAERDGGDVQAQRPEDGMRQRMQGAGFGNGFAGERQAGAPGWTRGPPQPEALLVMAQRILGPEPALGFSGAEARLQGKAVCPTHARFQDGAGGVFGVAAAEALKSGFPGGGRRPASTLW